jgi:hypothetical protein
MAEIFLQHLEEQCVKQLLDSRYTRYVDDILIIYDSNKIQTKIIHIRKPTTTDTTINFESNHPLEHKTAAFRYHITRMHLLPLTAEKKQKELKIIQYIATKNNFPQNLLQKINNK